jgi:hypothetical protein
VVPPGLVAVNVRIEPSPGLVGVAVVVGVAVNVEIEPPETVVVGVAVNVEIEPPETVVVGVAVNVEIEPPESVVGVAVVVGVVSNLGHPKFVDSPNVCSLSNCSSSFEVVGEVFGGNSTDALSIDDSCSHSSNLKVSPHEKMERFYNRPNLSYSVESDTSGLSTDATTNHH